MFWSNWARLTKRLRCCATEWRPACSVLLSDRPAIRSGLGLKGLVLISVGALIERKGHHRTIEAMRQLPDFELIIVGEGPERHRLGRLIGDYGLADRVRLLGPRPHTDLPALYGAADALCACVVARRVRERSAGI